jgi:alkylhydroperoxidase family enzyme
MPEPCGRSRLVEHATDCARAVDALEAASWRAITAIDRLDLFDLAARAVATQHGLEPLERPAESGPSPWSEADVSGWRRREDFDGAARAALHLAEQMAFDVASTQPEQREAFFSALGGDAVPFAQAIYAADLIPRARAALDALFGASDWPAPETVHTPDLGAAVEEVIRVVPGLERLDPVITELVRLLGARRHACRVCQSVRSYSAMAAGADDRLFDAVERHATSDYSPEQKAALTFAEGMLSSPARFEPSVVSELLRHYSPEACVELVLDVLRNATNKVAVALGGDAPRVETGYEVYDVKPTGEIVYGLEAPTPT